MSERTDQLARQQAQLMEARDAARRVGALSGAIGCGVSVGRDGEVLLSVRDFRPTKNPLLEHLGVPPGQTTTIAPAKLRAIYGVSRKPQRHPVDDLEHAARIAASLMTNSRHAIAAEVIERAGCAPQLRVRDDRRSSENALRERRGVRPGRAMEADVQVFIDLYAELLDARDEGAS